MTLVFFGAKGRLAYCHMVNLLKNRQKSFKVLNVICL